MRRTLMTGLLLLALSCPAFAGEMHTPPAPTPPQPASAVQEPTDEPTLSGEMSTPRVSDSLTLLALELLAVLPTLL